MILSKRYLDKTLSWLSTAYRLRSASCGSVPGRVTVIVGAELTSYLRWGLLQIFNRTKKLKTVFDRTPINGCTVSGKKLKCKFRFNSDWLCIITQKGRVHIRPDKIIFSVQKISWIILYNIITIDIRKSINNWQFNMQILMATRVSTITYN